MAIRESDVVAAANARLPAHSVNIRHNKGKAASNLCQYKLSGKEFGYNQTIEEMIDDEVKIYPRHGDVTEHSQAKRCCRVEHWASHMIEPAQGEDATEVSAMDVSIDSTNTQQVCEQQ